jgi:predicted acylesterase/phospholipase RssA/CRP-like cAMP-binding protein
LVTAGDTTSQAGDRRILNTLEKYFGIPLTSGHALLDEVETRHLAGGEWLIHQGDSGDSLYFLVRGRLQAWAAGPEGQPRGRLLNEIVPGDSVGELSLLTGAPRTVGIQAIRDSLLVRLDREAFDRLAEEYPSLVLRLASNVATLLQSKARARPSTRDLKTISILPLDETPRAMEFCRELAARLDQRGGALNLTADNLGRRGAPFATVAGENQVPHALAHWLHDQEDCHRFLLFQCAASEPAWTRFSQRQSDLVVFVADTAENPARRSWEGSLADTSGATIARRMLVLLQPGHNRPIRDTARWLADRQFDFHVQVREDCPEDVGRVIRIISGQALGLVLAGGAARGFAHLGVYRAMKELGLAIDWVGGTSLGAIMAAVLASPYPLDEGIELARRAFVRGKPFSDFTLPLVSLIGGRRMDRLLRQYLDLMIEDLPIPFFCVSCHLDNGAMRLHHAGYLPDALRASASIPGIIPPAVVDHRLTVDGAVINNLPVDIMQQKPVGTIVAVDLSADHVVEVDYPALPSAWAVLRGRYLPFSRKYRVPGLSTVLLKATELGTLARVRELGRQADLLLQPPVRQFGMTEVKSFDRIVQAGYEHAMEHLPPWLERRRGGADAAD